MSGIRSVRIDNFREMIEVRSDRIEIKRIRKLFEICKGIDEDMDESKMRLCGHIKRIE